jgi:thiamine kinase-like enzyme
MDPRVRQILNQVPGWSAASATVSALEGGMTNRNYRVERAGEVFVLRLAGESTHLLGIDRKNEHVASSIAAEVGVGAEVICFLEQENALITRFVSGQPITPEMARQPENMERIAESIRLYHGGRAFPREFSVFKGVRAYCTVAQGHGVYFPETALAALGQLDQIERALGPLGHPVPCHNDLLAANFIDDGKTVRILDWEYAGMGDAFFDLGNFAANQRLDRDECELLLRFYLGEVRRPDIAHLHLMRIASDLRESFWGFLQTGISPLDFDFEKYARDHLERFLKNCAAPEFSSWLLI